MWTSTNGVKFHLTSPLDVSVVKGRITFFCNFNQTVFTKNKGMLKDNKPQATHHPVLAISLLGKHLYHKCQNYFFVSIYHMYDNKRQ